MPWLGDSITRAKRSYQRWMERFWQLPVTLMGAAGLFLLGRWAGAAQGLSWELAGGVGLAVLAALLMWAKEYLSMFGSERERREAAEKARDEAQRRADEFFPEIMKLLKQIAANTAPSPTQSARPIGIRTQW